MKMLARFALSQALERREPLLAGPSESIIAICPNRLWRIDRLPRVRGDFTKICRAVATALGRGVPKVRRRDRADGYNINASEKNDGPDCCSTLLWLVTSSASCQPSAEEGATIASLLSTEAMLMNPAASMHIRNVDSSNTRWCSIVSFSPIADIFCFHSGSDGDNSFIGP